eukprot:gene1681-2333_t
MWTWSIVDREKYSGEKGGAPVTLGAAMASFANAEKERLDQERAGVRTSRLAASKWRARSTKFAMEDMAAIEEDEDSRPEDSETRAEKEEEVEDAPAIESELQQRVRKGWRWRNMFSGTAAAGLSRSLQPVAALENSFAPLVQAEEEKTEEEEKEEEEEGGRRMGLKYSDGFWSPPPASVASSGVAPNDMVGAHPLPPAEAEGGLSNASKTPSPSCAALPHGAYTVRWDAVNSATAARTPAGYPGVPDDSRAQLDTPDTIIMDIKHAKLKMAVPRLPPFVARYQMRNPRNRRILEDADQRTPKSSKGEHEVARETLTTRSAYSHVPNSRVTAVDPTGEAIQGSSPELMTTPAGSSVGRAADVLARTKMLRAARPSEGVAIEPAAPAKRLAQLKTAAPPAGYEMRIPGDLQISCDMADDLRRETASEKGSSPHGPPSSGPVMENYQLLGTWKEQVEEERARKRGEEEQGREERGSVAKSLHSIRQSIGASLMSTSDLKRAAAKRQKKKEAVSARVLFTSMKINVFRLQLSIPLDYLEQQAQLEMMDADRLSRRHSESARSKPGVSAAPQEPAVNRSIHPAGAPASRDFTAGTAMQGSSPELMTKMAEVLGSTKSFLADGPSEGVAVKPAAPAKAALCESRAAGVEKATSVKASHMWGMLRKRTLELPVERMLGTALVQAFLEAHNRRVIALYEAKGPKAKLSKEGQAKFSEMAWGERWVALHRLRRRNWIKVKRNVRWLLKAHPLGAILLVSATEPFSRSERILVQTNTFVMMLVFTVWFYYSKAVNCCKDFREFVSCPAYSDVTLPCFGYEFCADLKGAGADTMLPEESLPADFFCTAFPQSTFTGRMWVIAIIVGILTPVTMLLSQLFMMAANANIPAHWGIYTSDTFRICSEGSRQGKVTKKSEMLFGAAPAAVMQTVFVTVYALFFNFQKFNKAVAVAFVSVIALLVKPRHIQRGLALCVQSAKLLYTQEEELLERVHLISPVEEHLQKMAYFILICAWFMCAWSLFTYSMLIRNMMGAEAESELIASWATVLAVEMFGKETIKLIALRIFVDELMSKIERLFTDQDHPAHHWLEKYIMTVIMLNASEDPDDNGDQDMGDDADADGGGDDVIGTGCE